jgi:hypothetical protein
VTPLFADGVWRRVQVTTSLDIESTWYNEWFHGGLQYQVEHHLFPRIPRHNLWRVRPVVQALCAKHGLRFNCVGFIEANRMLVRSFLDVANVVDSVDLDEVRRSVAVTSSPSLDLRNVRLAASIVAPHPHHTPCVCVARSCVWAWQVKKMPAHDGKTSTAIEVFKSSALCHGLFARG